MLFASKWTIVVIYTLQNMDIVRFQKAYLIDVVLGYLLASAVPYDT